MPSIYIPPTPNDPRRLGFSPRRNIGSINQRQRTINYKVGQGLAASSVPVMATVYPFLSSPVYLSLLQQFHVFLTATQAVSGTPAGVQIVVQMVDVSGNFTAMAGSPYAITILGGVTTGLLAAPLLITNHGDLVAIGLQATTPWAGGQLMLSVKGKG